MHPLISPRRTLRRGGGPMMEEPMPVSPFWTAFYTGLAAPTALYAPPVDYSLYARLPAPAVSFAMVGAYLTRAVQGSPSGGHDELAA